MLWPRSLPHNKKFRLDEHHHRNAHGSARNFRAFVCGGKECYGFQRCANLFASLLLTVQAHFRFSRWRTTAPTRHSLKWTTRNMSSTSKWMASDGNIPHVDAIHRNESSAEAVPSTNECTKVWTPETKIKMVTTLYFIWMEGRRRMRSVLHALLLSVSGHKCAEGWTHVCVFCWLSCVCRLCGSWIRLMFFADSASVAEPRGLSATRWY